MLRRMKERMLLMRLGELVARTMGVFRTHGAFQKAIETGYIPPHTTQRLAGEGRNTLNFSNFFVYGNNPGYWPFHGHDTRRVKNNGIYPGPGGCSPCWRTRR